MNENKAQNQAIHQAIAKAAEAKTVVNGQELSVKDAQAAEESFMRQNTQTGIQAHHNNNSEAVEAGQVAQNQSQNQSQNMSGQNNMQNHAAAQHMQNMQNQSAQNMQQSKAVKAFDVQSGQQHLSQHIQEAQQASQQSEQQMQQAQQQKMQKIQQQQQQMAQKTQGLSQEQKVAVEAHQEIQGDLDAKAAKAKAKKG